MFTGIVERTLPLAEVVDRGAIRRLVLPRAWGDVRHGDSIALNGTCLTVAELLPDGLGFDVIKESLEKTNLGRLTKGDAVNVERALRAGDRMDGHFVQGHVDGPAELIHRVANDQEWRLRCRVSPALGKYLAPKGSVAIDGVSLTIAAVLPGDEFEVALIPTTLKLTTLGDRPIGWAFNFEADILSKTIVGWLEDRFGASAPLVDAAIRAISERVADGRGVDGTSAENGSRA